MLSVITREPEIFAAAKELRAKYEKLGTVGYCFGGWAVLRLGAKEHEKPLVDCVVCAHPSWATKDDIDNYANAPIQFLCPEVDNQFPDDLKLHAFQELVSIPCIVFSLSRESGKVFDITDGVTLGPGQKGR